MYSKIDFKAPIYCEAIHVTLKMVLDKLPNAGDFESVRSKLLCGGLRSWKYLYESRILEIFLSKVYLAWASQIYHCILFWNHTFCIFSEGRYENVRDVVFYGCDEVQGQKSGFRVHNPIQKLVGVMEENPLGLKKFLEPFVLSVHHFSLAHLPLWRLTE